MSLLDTLKALSIDTADGEDDEGGPRRVTIPLRSSWLAEASWDELSGDLEITTVSGETYTYPGVGVETVVGLATAPSPGRYWHQRLK